MRIFNLFIIKKLIAGIIRNHLLISCCIILLLASIARAQGESENTQLRSQLLARYRQLYGALESRNTAAAARNLAADYAEHQSENKPLSRAERESHWNQWLESRPSVGPIYITIENLEQKDASNVIATARIVTVASVLAKNGETNQEIADELRRDIWVRTSQTWKLQRSELLIPHVSGEIIPGPDEPDSPQLRALTESLRTRDSNALAAFWRKLERRAPLIEHIPGENENRLVTFIWRHSPEIENVELFGNLPFPPSGNRSLVRLPGTDVWYRSLRMPVNTRTTYGFDVYRKFTVPPRGNGKLNRSVPFIVSVPDPRNLRIFNENSVLELSGPPSPSYAVERADIPKGKISRENIRSSILGEERTVTVYTPPGFEQSKESYPIVVLFDGSTYGGGQRPLIPTPTILDNLIAENLIPHVIAVLVHQKKREPELGGSTKFTQFLAEEIMPLTRQRFRGTIDPAQVVIGGSSLGGLAAAYAALERPEVFGNVLSQSGAFWLPRDVSNPVRQELIPPRIWLIDEFIERPLVPVRLWMEVSLFESPAKMLGPNRQLRDVLRAKGYNITYRELAYGHDYLHWRESLAEGLISLLGTSKAKH